MCGRYTLTLPLDQLAAVLNIEAAGLDFHPRYNIAPTQFLPVILNEDPHTFQMLKWGLVPFWAKDPGIGNKMINARAETLAQKPSFRNALKQRRCLVLADGFYEWKKTGTGKVPHHIRMKSREVMTFAGLWEKWKDGEGKELRTFTLITVPPNELMEDLHNRMPAILGPEERVDWLDMGLAPESALELLKPHPSEPMEAVPVSTAVNSPRNEGPQLLETPNTLF